MEHQFPLEKEMATHSSIVAWRISWTEEPWWATVHRVTNLKDLEFIFSYLEKASEYANSSYQGIVEVCL